MKRKKKNKEDSLAWWREARFGMFIHWGIYSVPAGIWKGKDIPSLGEWVMFNAKIPVKEYEEIAKEFNPVKFNAEEWVRIAKNAGMKYIVITAKHHDGFAMFNSPSDKYNIVNATPYGKDPMKSLAKACKKEGVKFGFYYSQSQDWHEPAAAHTMLRYQSENKNPSGFSNYLHNKVKPQLKELLTQYGPIALIWFDTPAFMTQKQSLDLKHFVHKLQPECLVSGRIGNDVGDYGSLGDNQTSLGKIIGDWESPATLNDTWGFKKKDNNWKSLSTLLLFLIHLVSKGVNYLLNVGPTPEGIIPAPSVKLLEGIGKWMKINGEAIYGTSASPYPYEFEWGCITQKSGKLYLLFVNWPKKRFVLSGLHNKVKKAYLLLDRKKDIEVVQSHDKQIDYYALKLNLPKKKPAPIISTVVLEVEGKVKVDTLPLEQSNETINFPVSMADIHSKSNHKVCINKYGITENWCNKKDWLSWNFKLAKPGDYDAKIITEFPHNWKWQGGHIVNVSVAGEKLRCVIKFDKKSHSSSAKYLSETVSNVGRIRFKQPGIYQIKLKTEKIKKHHKLSVVSVELVPAKSN